jgi:hypothetical protein
MQIQPKEIRITTPAGDERVYILAKFPAIAGREIVAKYPLSAMPKLGDYEVNEATMMKLMAYVGVPVEGKDAPLMLNTRALIDNHIPDWETLARVEIAMMEYNVSFFANGKASGFLELIVKKAQALLSQTLMGSLEQLLPKEKPASTN